VDLVYEWYIIELRVFYGYILAAIIFLTLAQHVGINKNAYELFGDDNFRDFMVRFQSSINNFCINAFEISTTVIMFISYYASKNKKDEENGNYLPAMIILLFYGLTTLATTFHLFRPQ
jgi:hypothetical protein